MTAWDLVGFGGNLNDLDPDAPDEPCSVRVVGGRTLYEAVDYNDARGGRMVRLARVEVTARGLRQVNRYVEPDTPLEVVPG